MYVALLHFIPKVHDKKHAFSFDFPEAQIAEDLRRLFNLF